MLNEESYNEYPLITVVTATYNKFGYLFNSIDSVFAQDYPNIEYIICDDGSENFPIVEVENHIKTLNNDNIKNVRILTSETNRGTVKNLNDAYKKSKGMYIFNLSCGDVFFSADVISKLVNIFMDNKCDVVVASRIMYKGDYEPTCLLPHYGEREILNSKYNSSISQYKALILGMYYDMASGSAMYYSRNIMEKYGYYDERYTLFEDGPFLSKYLLNNKLYFAYDIISIWYQSGGISDDSSAPVNPIYQKDLDLFNYVDRKQHIELLSNAEKRMLKFCYELMNTNRKKLKKILVAIKYFPVPFKYLVYKLSRKRRKKEDIRIINKILKKQ